MRTIRVELQAQVDVSSQVAVSTEVIVEDDQNVDDAGREARAALDQFMAGFAEDPA